MSLSARWRAFERGFVVVRIGLDRSPLRRDERKALRQEGNFENWVSPNLPTEPLKNGQQTHPLYRLNALVRGVISG